MALSVHPDTVFLSAPDAIQSRHDLERLYRDPDPFKDEKNPNSAKRRDFLISEIPSGPYQRTLDIGCGNGFITRALPGDAVVGLDIAAAAVEAAKQHPQNNVSRLSFRQGTLFHLEALLADNGPFDLVVLSNILYPQYIGFAKAFVYQQVDAILAQGGTLVCCHDDALYRARFPYLMLREQFFVYEGKTLRLEVYHK
jgi:SAM-dependent methyltransferase